MNFYERISKKKVEMPVALDIELGQMIDIETHSAGIMDAMWIAFKFGYMQGERGSQIKGGRITV